MIRSLLVTSVGLGLITSINAAPRTSHGSAHKDQTEMVAIAKAVHANSTFFWNEADSNLAKSRERGNNVVISEKIASPIEQSSQNRPSTSLREGIIVTVVTAIAISILLFFGRIKPGENAVSTNLRTAPTIAANALNRRIPLPMDAVSVYLRQCGLNVIRQQAEGTKLDAGHLRTLIDAAIHGSGESALVVAAIAMSCATSETNNHKTEALCWISFADYVGYRLDLSHDRSRIYSMAAEDIGDELLLESQEKFRRLQSAFGDIVSIRRGLR